MSAKRLLEMTQLWKEELEALRLDNKQLRYQLLCSFCRANLDSKKPGDTIVALTCPHCIGIS